MNRRETTQPSTVGGGSTSWTSKKRGFTRVRATVADRHPVDVSMRNTNRSCRTIDSDNPRTIDIGKPGAIGAAIQIGAKPTDGC